MALLPSFSILIQVGIFMNNGLTKARRITKNGEFQLVYKHGKFDVNRFCVLYRMPVANEKTKIGFVTGKKVGCAVLRNRAKRLMKEVYRLHQHELKEGYRLVLVGRAGINGATYEEAEKEILKLFKRSKLLKV